MKYTILIMILFIVGGCQKDKDRNGNTEIDKSVLFGADSTIEINQDFVATVQPTVSLQFTILRSGVITSLKPNGTLVKKGEVILSVNSAVERARLSEASVKLEKANNNFEAVKTLFDSKKISKSDFLTSKLALETAKLNYQIGRREISRSRLIAPTDGVVRLSRDLVVGLPVDSGDASLSLLSKCGRTALAESKNVNKFLKVGDTIITNNDRAITSSITIDDGKESIIFQLPKEYISNSKLNLSKNYLIKTIKLPSSAVVNSSVTIKKNGLIKSIAVTTVLKDKKFSYLLGDFSTDDSVIVK